MIMGEQTHVQNKLIGERTVAGANEPVTTQLKKNQHNISH